MISFPNSKINLGLYITAKREDGYHDIETIFFPIPFTDILEFVSSEADQFTNTGIPIEGDPQQNLCVKAYQLLKALHPELPPIHIHLHKIIPMGAGLGGGSADGAFMLNTLNRFFELGHRQVELNTLALKLGSDCPFFLNNKPSFGRGRGEILEPVALSLTGWWLVLVHPGLHVSTAEAFKSIVPKPSSINLSKKILDPVESWKEWLKNDFEPCVIQIHPVIGQVKERLYSIGAAYASMSGSGSAIYGFFREKPTVEFPHEFLVRTVEIK